MKGQMIQGYTHPMRNIVDRIRNLFNPRSMPIQFILITEPDVLIYPMINASNLYAVPCDETALKIIHDSLRSTKTEESE